MGFSNARAAAILNEEFRSETVYLALYTSDPTGADTGNEVSGGGYVRQEIAFMPPMLDGGKQTLRNGTEISFPVATDDWGTVTHIGIRTAATGGDLIASAALNAARSIFSGDRFVIDVSNAIVRLQ